MAEASIDVTVSVEKAIHEAARKFAEAVFEKHGLRVRSIDIDWYRTGGIGGPPRDCIAEISIRTES